MKLSEAMRLADEMSIPNRRRSYIETDTRKWKGKLPPSCAIGGANVASRYFVCSTCEDGLLTSQSHATAVPIGHFDGVEPFLEIAPFVECPHNHRQRCCPSESDELVDIIIHLYDDCRWSRTRIAAWLETLGC